VTLIVTDNVAIVVIMGSAISVTVRILPRWPLFRIVEQIADLVVAHGPLRARSLKSISAGGRTILTRRPSVCQRCAAASAAFIPGLSASAAIQIRCAKFGNSKAFSPPVERAATVGMPVAWNTDKPVSIPSEIAISSQAEGLG
jgi:hypothetical protein